MVLVESPGELPKGGEGAPIGWTLVLMFGIGTMLYSVHGILQMI